MDPSKRPGERFTRTRLRPGYRVADVESLLERAEAGTLTARDVEAVRFGTTRGGEGYDEAEVDEALEALVARLRAEGKGGPEPEKAEHWWSRLFGDRDT